jgi:[ribosomal protein S5]-alanine N-acetyltransferase
VRSSTVASPDVPASSEDGAPSLGSVSEVTTPLQLRAAFTPVYTDRLLLRAVSESDVDASFVIHGDPATYRFHPSGVTRSREQSAAQLVGWQREWMEPGFGFWAVSLTDEERVIGFGGLTRRPFRERPVLNTYYRFAPSAWGHGYATEMVGAALGLAKRLLAELPVIVRTRSANLAARSVAEKVGLQRAPELDDHMLTYVSHWDAHARRGEPDGNGQARDDPPT